MGVFDLFGTTASGWLTDRYDPRRLLFVYYAVRGAALVYLPFSNFSLYSLSIFAVFYGLDWIATVPPTLRLTTEVFGEAAAPVIFGCMVFTRPSSISGKLVTSLTSATGIADSRSNRAVPPVEISSAPSSFKPRANAATPVLSVTLMSTLMGGKS